MEMMMVIQDDYKDQFEAINNAFLALMTKVEQSYCN